MATTFSMPTTLTSTSGRVRHIRPLPSDSTTTRVPVSATAKLAPLTPTFARRNFSRRCSRAAPASTAGSSVRSAGAGRPTAAIRRRKISRTSARLRWIAGTRMWDGRSSPSWTMSSARSVSQAAMPSASRASLRPISAVAIDLTLTTSSAPWSWATRATIAHASSASRAQWTVAPARTSDASRVSRWVARSRSAASLTPAPASRRSSQSSTSATTLARLSRMVCVAWARLRRSWVSPSAARAAVGKAGMPTKVPVTLHRPRCWPGPRRGAGRVRPRAGATASRRRASGTSCPPRPAPRPRCRGRGVPCRRPSRPTCRRS